MPRSAVDDLLQSAAFVNAIDARTWEEVRRAFPERALDRWMELLHRIAATGDAGTILAFARGSVAVATTHGVDLSIAMAGTGLLIGGVAGPLAMKFFFAAIPGISPGFSGHPPFRLWLRTMEELASLAPASVETVLQQSLSVLKRLSVSAFRLWVLNGLRLSGGDPGRLAAYFVQTDTETLLPYEQEAGHVHFATVEKSLRSFVVALWRWRPAIRTATVRAGGRAPRRSSFEGNIIRIPDNYAGYRGQEAAAHFHAVMAHLGAHARYSRDKQPVGTLKPIQVALVGLIEDARVEALAAAEYPGLRRLWARFHNAQPGSSHTAEILMGRLARALIDPRYGDDDPWVNKGRMMFHERKSRWEEPAISREIGGLLGNDIGQMRIQFNAKTFVIEPSYRDDNLGLWDFGELPPEQAQEAETVLDSVRITQKEDKQSRERRDPRDNDTPAGMAARLHLAPEEQGLPIARHAEWDHVSGTLRRDWTTVLEFLPPAASTSLIDSILEDYAEVETRIARLVKAAKISRPARLRRQPQGDRLDIDASIAAAIERRAGFTPDARIFESREMRSRDLSVLLLLDVSESTRDRIRDTTTTVIAMQRAAAALLSQAMSELGDPFAIHAFCSNGREEVRYYRVKDFTQPYGAGTRARLAGLRGMLSTRLGAALRQAGDEIAAEPTHRKLVLVITDGEPSDVDVADRKYLVEDARKAVHELSQRGLDVFCVGLDSGGDSYLPRIFGLRNYLMIKRVEALPEKLPLLYFRLTH